MTRDEFMDIANKEIDQMLATQKNRIMGLVERAWAEGKKNAEVSGIEDVVKEAIEKIYQQSGTQELLQRNIPITTPDIPYEQHQLKWSLNTDIPSACQGCSNHPSNGGSGICNCIVGIPQIKC